MIVVAGFTGSSNFVTGVTDSQGNTYVQAGSGNSTVTGTLGSSLWYAQNITGGTTPTITVAYSTNTANTFAAIAREYSGIDINNPIDALPTSNNGASTSPTSAASGATLYQAELLIGFAVDTLAANTFSAGTGYGNLATQANGFGLAMEDQQVSSTGSYTATFTISPTSTSWGAGIATFRAALPVSVVQSLQQDTTSPATISLPNTPIQGNLILIRVNDVNQNTIPTSVKDGNSNSFTELAFQARTTIQSYSLWGLIAGASQSNVFTVTRGTQAGLREAVYEISSVTGWPAIGSIIDGTPPIAGTTGGAATSTGSGEATVTTSQATDIIWVALGLGSSQTAPVLTANTGPGVNTLLVNNTNSDGFMVETSIGTYGASATWTGSTPWVSLAVPLKPIVSVASTTHFLTTLGAGT
jgi:hypothetical protein